jgi:hypothetical protein
VIFRIAVVVVMAAALSFITTYKTWDHAAIFPCRIELSIRDSDGSAIPNAKISSEAVPPGSDTEGVFGPLDSGQPMVSDSAGLLRCAIRNPIVLSGSDWYLLWFIPIRGRRPDEVVCEVFAPGYASKRLMLKEILSNEPKHDRTTTPSDALGTLPVVNAVVELHKL